MTPLSPRVCPPRQRDSAESSALRLVSRPRSVVRSADKNGNAMNLYPGTCPVDLWSVDCAVKYRTCVKYYSQQWPMGRKLQ